MQQKIEHIGIAVKDLESSIQLYESLMDTTVYKQELVESQRVITAFLRSGPNKIELVASADPEDPDNVINKYLAKKGEGIHHMAFAVADIRAEMARLENEGFRLLSTEPQLGADSKLVCFVHPKTAGGCLIELVQDT